MFENPLAIDATGTIAEQVFESGEVRLHDARRAPDAANQGTLIRSELVVPLGEHGVFLLSLRTVGDIDETDVT